MTVQMTSTLSAAFSYGNRISSVSNSEQSFDSLLQTGANSSANMKKSNTQYTDSGKQSAAKVEKQEPADTVQKRYTTEDAEVKNVQEAENVSEPEEKQLSEEILSELLSILNEFAMLVQDHLQVDPEQLADAAENIQFGIVDCFDADRIKDLFLQVNNVEASELLTDENLYKSLEQLQNTVSDLLENSELYQLLQQEDLETASLGLQMFSEQISEFISPKLQPDEVDETTVVVEFENDLKVLNQSDLDEHSLSGMETESKISEITQETLNDRNSDEWSQSGSERSQTQAGLFLQKLVSVAKGSLTDSAQGINGSVELYDIATQIIDQVRLQIRPDNTRMELQLNPENLGKVELEISSKNGELSAKLNVQNDQVKEAVESQMQVLRETLEAQGLKVENIEVTVAEFGFRFQDEQGNAEQFRQQQRRNGTIHLDESETDEQSFSDVSEVMKELNGNSVDYVA